MILTFKWMVGMDVACTNCNSNQDKYDPSQSTTYSLVSSTTQTLSVIIIKKIISISMDPDRLVASLPKTQLLLIQLAQSKSQDLNFS
jgi:hypothetical protein